MASENLEIEESTNVEESTENSDIANTESDNSARMAELYNEIAILEEEKLSLEEDLQKIDQAIKNVNDCMSQTDSNGRVILNSGENSFKWLKNEMDSYWIDMNSTLRSECVEAFDKLSDESSGPISLINAEVSNVMAAAEEKITEIKNKIAELEEQLEAKKNELANLG